MQLMASVAEYGLGSEGLLNYVCVDIKEPNYWLTCHIDLKCHLYIYWRYFDFFFTEMFIE